MADFVDAFAGPPPGKGKVAASKKSDEFSDLDAAFAGPPPGKEKKKEPEKPDMLKGAVEMVGGTARTMGRGARVMADTAMKSIGADQRPETVGPPRPARNFVEGMAQDVAKASREEVSEQKKVGIGKAFAARSVGAVTGLPRFAEDARNAVKGAYYGAAEGVRGLTGGVNVVEELRRTAKQEDKRGNPLAPALGLLLDAYNLSEPSHHVEALTKTLGEITGAPATVESGQGDILNAVPLGVAGNTVGKGARAAAKAGLKAGGVMGAQTGLQVAGRETAASGKTFNPQNVAEATAKSFAVGATLGAGLHATLNGFNRTPKNIGKNPEAHARDTIVSTKPIEPQPKGREAKAFQKAIDASAELKAREAELAALGGDISPMGSRKATPLEMDAFLGRTPNAVHPGAERALKASYKLNGDPALEAKAGKATDRALSFGKKAQDLENPPEAKELVELAEPLPHPDEVAPAFETEPSATPGVPPGMRYADYLAQGKLRAKPSDGQPVGEVQKPTEVQSPPPVKSADGQPDVQALRATIADKKTATPEQRRQAQLELKKIEKAEKKSEKADAAPATGRRFKNIDADKPPQTPEAPPPREEDVITRAEFKRRTVKEQRPATPEEATRYKAVADAVAEHDYHQARYKAGLKQLAKDAEIQEGDIPTEKKKALSSESGALQEQIAAKITEMRKLAGESDAPEVDVYHKTFMGEHKPEPLKGGTIKEKLAELESIKREIDRYQGEIDSHVEGIKGRWKTKAEPSYKVDDRTYNPVEVTAPDGTKHHYAPFTTKGKGRAMSKAQAEAHALKQAKAEHGPMQEGAHPRAINVPTERGDVLLESYKEKPKFYEKKLPEVEAKVAPEDKPKFEAAKADYLELKQRDNAAGEYVGVNYEKLHGVLRKFIMQESGNMGLLHVADTAEAITKGAGRAAEGAEKARGVAKDVADIWATHVINKNKNGLEQFLKDREVVRDIIGASDKSKMERLGDVIKTALGHKNDMDWVRGYSPKLAEGLDSIRYRMDRAGQGVKRLSDAVQAREEFADAIDMTPQEVRDHKWQHLTKDQADFIADISELRADAADMISEVWDEWHDAGMPHHLESRHLEGLYKQYTGGVDIRTGLRDSMRKLDKALNHLQTGAYDAMVTGNMRIHTLHIVDALTMASSVVHPENLGRAAAEFAMNGEVRNFLKSYQGAGVYKQTRGSKLTWWEKNIGKGIELSAERILGKKGLEVAKMFEGGVLERHKIDIVRGAAIMRAGKEMGYEGNILQDVAREYATGKSILSPVQHAELSIRVLNQLEDAFGYNPAGFVNRNAFRQIGADRLFPFMGIRSVQNRLFSKFVSERNLKALFTLAITTQAFAGSHALLLPFEKALQFAAPESYIQMKHLLDMVSIAGAAEFGLKKMGVMDARPIFDFMGEKNEDWIAPFLRKIEHIQPEVVPWMFNEPSLVMNIYNLKDGLTWAKGLTMLSAAMGGSALAGITTPSQIESFWRLMGKAADGHVTEDENGKQIGGKKMSVYDRGIMGEKRLATKQHIETNYLREMLNYLLPKMDAVDERYANEAKFAAAAKTQLMRNGYDDKEVKSAFKQLYMPIHKEKRAVTAEEFIEFIHNHPPKN